MPFGKEAQRSEGLIGRDKWSPGGGGAGLQNWSSFSIHRLEAMRSTFDLEPALQAEMTGILNRSLDGLARLTNNGGRFTRVPWADEAIIAMRDLASPVAACQTE